MEAVTARLGVISRKKKTRIVQSPHLGGFGVEAILYAEIRRREIELDTIPTHQYDGS